MINPSIRGVVHGKTIELASDPGLDEGQIVDVTLRPAQGARVWGEGLQRAAGALSDSWEEEDDRILEQLQADRARSTDRELPS